jgi:hypothetical protein
MLHYSRRLFFGKQKEAESNQLLKIAKDPKMFA